MSQSAYYQSRKGILSPQVQRRNQFKEKIRILFIRHQRRYGRIRIHRSLLQQGEKISEKMVGSIMKELGLIALKKRAYRPNTTQPSATYLKVPNLLKHHRYTQPNECLVGDITYVATKEGWLFLAGYMDIYSKMIKGYSLAQKMPAKLVTDALNKALYRYPALKGAVVHSDRGCQYTSHRYLQLLQNKGLKVSMGEKANCYDNAAIESFWSTLKTECFPSSGVFETKAQAKAAIFEYIESYYNTQRLHSSLNYTFPLAAELAA